MKLAVVSVCFWVAFFGTFQSCFRLLPNHRKSPKPTAITASTYFDFGTIISGSSSHKSGSSVATCGSFWLLLANWCQHLYTHLRASDFEWSKASEAFPAAFTSPIPTWLKLFYSFRSNACPCTSNTFHCLEDINWKIVTGFESNNSFSY